MAVREQSQIRLHLSTQGEYSRIAETMQSSRGLEDVALGSTDLRLKISLGYYGADSEVNSPV
jgi:hypothetical protein